MGLAGPGEARSGAPSSQRLVTGIYTPARWDASGRGYKQRPWEGTFVTTSARTASESRRKERLPGMSAESRLYCWRLDVDRGLEERDADVRIPTDDDVGYRDAAALVSI
jgi:hypothetical protein